MNNTDLDKLLSKVSKQLTPEYFDELAKKCYVDDREYPENFSNWYKHIIDFGNFKHADIISNQIFTLEDIKVMQETYMHLFPTIQDEVVDLLDNL